MKNLLNKLKQKQPQTAEESALLTVTEAAKAKIQSVIEDQGMEVEGLRVSISGRSASAFEYGLGLEVEPNPDDVLVDCGDFKVLIDPESAENLKGATIDYVEDLNSSVAAFHGLGPTERNVVAGWNVPAPTSMS